MLAECALDIAVVATPNDLHHAQTLAAIEAGAHVVCDKPLALDSAQARDMLDAADTARRCVTSSRSGCASCPRSRARANCSQTARSAQPVFADVQFLNCGWGDPEGPMRWQFERARAGSGALSNIGSHAIDALHWLAGDVRRICATTAIAVPVRHWPDGREARPDADDTAAFVAQLANGAPVTFLASHVAYTTRSAFSLAVHCSAGSVTASLDTTMDDPRGRLSVMRRGDEAPREEVLAGPRAREAGSSTAPTTRSPRSSSTRSARGATRARISQTASASRPRSTRRWHRSRRAAGPRSHMATQGRSARWSSECAWRACSTATGSRPSS